MCACVCVEWGSEFKNHKKEWNSIIGSNVNGVVGHYVKWNKPVTEQQVLCIITQVEATNTDLIDVE
jgi:hypothetical protein